MKKKECEKPSVEVVKLQTRSALLIGSTDALKQDYGNQQDLGTWEDM